MRLGTCVALEVFCAGTVGAALALGGRATALELQRFAEAEAAAGEAPVASIDSGVGELGRVEAVGIFGGVSDEVLLEPLRSGAIESVKFNRGGSSISLRIDFDNGSRAAFKPRQTSLHSVPRYEVAAFRVNRLLGLSTVAPAIGRKLAVADLLGKLREDSVVFAPRMTAEMLAVDGEVIGELSWWIPVIKPPYISGFLIDSVDGVLTWSRYLEVGAAIPANERRLVAQISDMVLFDFVIDNNDRWSGRNVWVSEDGRVLYFMDNTLSFGGDEDGSYKSRTYLSKAEKFSRSLVANLRSLTEQRLRAALGRDVAPFEVLLDDAEIAAVLGRRRYTLDYIDGLIAEHGVEKVLVFP